MNNITENLMKSDMSKFLPFFSNSGNFVKNHIFEYLDIFSIGKFGFCNKELYNFIYKKFNLDKISKNYCLAIFKNSSLYLNDQEKIKQKYKNYYEMFKKRPRVKFEGIYYSRVKFNKVGDNYGFSDQILSTVTYFRILRFLPNGEIFSITTPYFKHTKIINAINKNNLEMRRGRFFIDFDDTLIVELAANSTSKSSSYFYRYKVHYILIRYLDEGDY
jgi:hypothetical protein